MKTAFLVLLFQFFLTVVFAQQVAIATDKTSVFYLGVDNPLTVTAENCPCHNLVVKTDNGKITGTGCKLSYWGNTVGTATIKVYKRTQGTLKKIGSNVFRVKRIPAPSFKIGPYGGSIYANLERKAKKVVIANQQFVRAEFDWIGIDANFPVDSFYVTIFYTDSSKTKTFFNTSNAIRQELREAFSILKKDDIIIFDKIFVKGLDGLEWELDPLILSIEN